MTWTKSVFISDRVVLSVWFYQILVPGKQRGLLGALTDVTLLLPPLFGGWKRQTHRWFPRRKIEGGERFGNLSFDLSQRSKRILRRFHVSLIQPRQGWPRKKGYNLTLHATFVRSFFRCTCTHLKLRFSRNVFFLSLILHHPSSIATTTTSFPPDLALYAKWLERKLQEINSARFLCFRRSKVSSWHREIKVIPRSTFLTEEIVHLKSEWLFAVGFCFAADRIIAPHCLFMTVPYIIFQGYILLWYLLTWLCEADMWIHKSWASRSIDLSICLWCHCEKISAQRR